MCGISNHLPIFCLESSSARENTKDIGAFWAAFPPQERKVKCKKKNEKALDDKRPVWKNKAQK